MQYQFVCKKRTFHPAVPNSDTLVDVSVTVHPIHVDQGFSQFLGEGHINYCTTVQGPDILHSTKSTHFCKYYFFIISKMCFGAGWNSFACRILPAGRSVENPDIDCEEEWWQHAPLLKSNTTLNGCHLTLSTETQSSELEYSYLTASKRHPLTPYSQSFLRRSRPTIYFLQVNETCV